MTMKTHPSGDTLIRVRRTLFGGLVYSILVWNAVDHRYYIQMESSDLEKMERMEKLIAQQISEEKRLEREKKLHPPREKKKEKKVKTCDDRNQTRML